jgi:hypothetical protein
MLADTTLTNSEKVKEALHSLTGFALDYAIQNPAVVAKTAENVVSVVAPIVEGAATQTISRAFGNAEAVGFINSGMLGAIKGAIGVGIEKSHGLVDSAGYIAGSAGRQAAVKVAEETGRLVSDPAVLAGAAASYVNPGLGTAVYAGMKLNKFGKRKSAGKRSARKNKKSVRKIKSKKSVRKIKSANRKLKKSLSRKRV